MEQDFFEDENDGTLKAEYADCFRIGHSAHKFVIDFGQMSHEGKGKKFHTRLITGPDTAQAIAETFASSILEFENKFGRIGRSH